MQGFTGLLEKALSGGFPSASHQGMGGLGKEPAWVSSVPSTLTYPGPAGVGMWPLGCWGEETSILLEGPHADACTLSLACGLHFLSFSFFLD